LPLPKELIESLKGIHGFDKEAMERVHNSSDRISSIRINPKKSGAGIFDDMEPVPWSNYGYYIKNRPSYTFDPRFHGGAYYVQEASGMFLEQAITQLVSFKENLKILDLRKNHLTELPESIKGLQNLEKLYLKGNKSSIELIKDLQMSFANTEIVFKRLFH